MSELATTYSLMGRVKEFQIPPVADGLVIGRDSPIGCSALTRALELLVPGQFRAIEIDDAVVGHVVVRGNLLRRMPEQRLVDFILGRVKPLMGADEIMHLDLSVEVHLDDGGS